MIGQGPDGPAEGRFFTRRTVLRMRPADTDIAIVGAGVAGIAAALEAGAQGLRYRLIEGRGRTGGRTWTSRTPRGLPFDLGASWIHAADAGNPFADIALARGAAPVVDRRRRVVLDAEGALLPPTALEAFHAARPLAIARIEAAPAGSSLADCLPVTGEPTADPWAWTMRSFAGPWLCGTDCALADTADWAAARAGTDWLLPAGYGTMVQAIAAGVPVTTGAALEALEVGRDGVRLSTSAGSFSARHVILTVPLGVLAAERIRFTPALPHAVRRALDDLPMGCLMKVGFDLLADPLAGLPAGTDTCFLHYPATDERAVLYLLRPCGHAMAYAFVGGSMARALEREVDPAVRDVVLAPLRRLLGAAVVERSFGPALVTRWGVDPFAFGSYAIARPGGAGARLVLAEPLQERVHLAGEATAPGGWHGTAGGAWLAGRAAVDRIAGATARPSP
jgi:monoamine oxidase